MAWSHATSADSDPDHLPMKAFVTESMVGSKAACGVTVSHFFHVNSITCTHFPSTTSREVVRSMQPLAFHTLYVAAQEGQLPRTIWSAAGTTGAVGSQSPPDTTEATGSATCCYTPKIINHRVTTPPPPPPCSIKTPYAEVSGRPRTPPITIQNCCLLRPRDLTQTFDLHCYLMCSTWASGPASTQHHSQTEYSPPPQLLCLPQPPHSPPPPAAPLPLMPPPAPHWVWPSSGRPAQPWLQPAAPHTPACRMRWGTGVGKKWWCVRQARAE